MRALSLFLGLLFATSAMPAPATYGRAEYYRPPQIGYMVGFIKDPQHQNYSIDEWRKGLGRNFDARALVARAKAAGAAHIIWYDKWIDGLVFRKTKTTTYHTERDFLAELMPECKRQGIRLLTYFNTFYDGNPEFAQWACTDQRGRRIAYPSPWPANALSIFSPYREKVLEQVRELVRDYDVDGVWLDCPAYPLFANDQWTRAAFAKQFGKPIDDASVEERRRFAMDAVTNWNRDVAALIHQLKPSAVVTTNAHVDPVAVGPRTAVNLAGPLDYFSTEMPTMDRQYRWTENFGRFLKPFEALTMVSDTWFTPLGAAPPVTNKSPAHMELEMATTLSAGVNLYLSLTLAHDGTLDEPALQLLDLCGRWVRSRRPWLKGAEGVHDVGIVMGTADPNDLDWPGGLEEYNETILKLEDNLRANGYLPRRFLNCRNVAVWDDIPPEVRALIIPDRVSLTVEDAAKVRRFAQAGGRVIAFGRGAGLAKSGTSPKADAIFGVRPTGEIALHKYTIAWANERIRLDGPLSQLHPEGADTMLWAGTPNTGVTPALTRARAGAGMAYALALPESLLIDQPKLAEYVWKEALGDTLYRISDHSGRYTVRLRRQGQRHILHVLDNLTVPPARVGEDRYRAEYVKLSIHAGRLPFRTATVQPDDRILPVTSSGEWKTFEIHPAPEILIELQ
jgi:hypothetical protein